ncbi:Spy/CpxP family protein refolding chaperone [Poseidonibacter lekithochrous]|uniref:Spy/CpxP family protein refolding chaperone n=1 Tax=Poseidonibacter TaxID=2321187 RepID=UPI001C0A127C|nr:MULTISPECIES: Spy/CpxP family protein refolding chaperone [Poseidonibacter]MBU3015914.1 Spy/CpxP family protein refolding chaperone [Poseidonibacter lekithochrous]MDO6829213.1 Spy/CpxP family protein refolding chaperone [Poseidonibacter sp. 1_MG-2023]
MKTKLLVATALTAVLSTGLYASCNGKKGMDNGNKSCTKQGGKHMMKKNHNKGQKGPMSLLRQLNLTAEQTQQIRDIKKDLMKNSITPNVAFTKSSFDKAKFIELMKQKRDNRIESKAEMIDRVYKVLTPKQKEQFKVLMDLKKEKRMSMMNKRMNSNKNHTNNK